MSALPDLEHHGVIAGGVVEPAWKINRVADVIQKEGDLIWRPADCEPRAHYQWSDSRVSSCRLNSTSGSGVHLNANQ